MKCRIHEYNGEFAGPWQCRHAARLEAMRGLQANNPTPEIASDEMVNFVVLNTAALHLIPTTVALLRQEYGAAVPMDIMPAAWLTSAAALCVGLAMAWLLRVRRRKRGG